MQKPPVIKPTIPPLLVVIADASLMIAGSKMPEWLLGTILGAAIVWFVLAAVSVRGNIVERWPKMREWFPFLDLTGGMATRAELAHRHIEGKTLRLVDVAQNGVVVGITFDDCVFHGPAVFAPAGTTVMRHPHFHASRGDIVYDFGDMKTRTGMIILEDCTLNRCVFYDIGIAQPKEHFLKTMTVIGKETKEAPESESGE